VEKESSLHSLQSSKSSFVNGGGNNHDENELYNLALLGGYHMDFQTFRVILDFLKLGVNPNSICRALEKINSIKRKTSSSQQS
jgi:hypothetical protein